MRFDAVPVELLARCQAGDMDAFDSLCMAIQDDLYAFVLSILRNHEDAADIHQECLVRVYRSLPKLRDLSKFAGWIMRMAVNQCNTQRASRSARVVSMEDVVAPGTEARPMFVQEADSPREVTAHHELQKHLNTAIDSLPPKQKTAILLYEVEMMSVRDIAELLECSEGVVKFNLFEARKKLRTVLTQIEPLYFQAEATSK
ncbi:MAG: RNA polymerase sigma factor [Candidatus Sumerlaeaceae bacterium]